MGYGQTRGVGAKPERSDSIPPSPPDLFVNPLRIVGSCAFSPENRSISDAPRAEHPLVSLFVASFVLALCSAGAAVAERASSPARPNVLFVISDDLSARISPAGYNGVKTPMLDRLAAEGTTFRRAYCQYPVCGPTRASFLTGLHPQSTRVFDNQLNIEETRPGPPTLPRVVRDAG